MSVLPDLAQLLEDASVGTLGTTIFMSRRPDSPGTCVTLTAYQGEDNRLHADTNIPADERLSVQVATRAADYATAETLADQAFTALHFRHKTLASGRRYAWSKANQSPGYIGVDANDRKLIVFNLRLRRHRTTDLT